MDNYFKNLRKNILTANVQAPKVWVAIYTSTYQKIVKSLLWTKNGSVTGSRFQGIHWLENNLQQFNCAFFGGIIGAQFAAEGTGEDGFFQQIDLLQRRFCTSLARRV